MSRPHGTPRVAIVHDWFVGGGAEKVVLEISRLFPEAPIYTSYCSPEWRQRLAPNQVITGYLQHWPFAQLRKFVPFLRQHWFSHLDLSGYDLIISSSGNGEAIGVRAPQGSTHICYCHTPTHFYWRHYDQYIRSPGFGIFNPLARLGLKLLAAPGRRWDYRAAQRVDHFIANSEHIKADIKRYYGQDATVIHPPVDVDRFKASTESRQGYVTIGRLVPYKRVDLIIEACNQLELPLTVVGRGPELKKLQALAGPTVTFDDHATDQAVKNYLGSAKGFIFAAFEDFGITPVEALASGTPVLAYKAGGALDYVKPGHNGAFFEKQTTASLVAALKKFDQQTFSVTQVAHTAADFSPAAFQRHIEAFLDSVRKDPELQK